MENVKKKKNEKKQVERPMEPYLHYLSLKCQAVT